MIGNHNPESGFREKCEVFGNYLLPSPRMCHLIVPKICGTPGFTEKSVFRKVHGQFQERMIGNHNPESGFCQKCEVFVHFSLQSSRMCHLIVPKICGTPGFTEKDRFSKGFQKQFKDGMIDKHNPESSFCQKCEVVGHFSLLAPRMCHLIVPQNLRDSRIHRKRSFFEGFSKAI